MQKDPLSFILTLADTFEEFARHNAAFDRILHLMVRAYWWITATVALEWNLKLKTISH